MYRAPGGGIAVGTGIGSSAATGAGVTWWAVADAVVLATGLPPAHATRGRRVTAGE